MIFVRFFFKFTQNLRNTSDNCFESGVAKLNRGVHIEVILVGEAVDIAVFLGTVAQYLAPGYCYDVKNALVVLGL